MPPIWNGYAVSETRTEYTVEQARAAGLLPVKGQGASKWHNRRTPCANGHTHASGAEARRCNELHLMQLAHEIWGLVPQPVFTLTLAFENGGKRYRASHYVGDFLYIESIGSRVICEDVKAFNHKTGKPIITALFRYKWKEVIRLNPTIEFRIVGA